MMPQRADMLTSTYLLTSQSEGFLKGGGDGRSSLLSVSVLSCNDPNTVTPPPYSFFYTDMSRAAGTLRTKRD